MQININRLKMHIDILYEEKQEIQKVLKELTYLYECADIDPTIDISFIKRQESTCRQQLENIQRRIDLLTETVDDSTSTQQHARRSLDSALRQIKRHNL